MVRLSCNIELNFELCCGEPDYSDEDLRLLDELDRWERQSPVQLQVQQCGKPVEGIVGLQAATKSEYRAELKAFFAPLAMAPEKVTRKVLAPRQLPTTQMLAYRRWRKVYLEKMTLPQPEHFPGKALEGLLKNFPQVHNLVELTMLFGFADQLPKQLRNLEREQQLMEIGFWDADEYYQVCADHDALLREVEVAKYQCPAELERCKRTLKDARSVIRSLESDNELLRQDIRRWQRRCQTLENALESATQGKQQWKRRYETLADILQHK